MRFFRLSIWFVVKPRQLCWAGAGGGGDARVRMCRCVYVCVSVNKISQKVFNQSTSFLVGAFTLTPR